MTRSGSVRWALLASLSGSVGCDEAPRDRLTGYDGFDCPDPPWINARFEESTHGFDGFDAVEAANRFTGGVLTLIDDGHTTAFSMSFESNAALVQISDPAFEPQYATENQERHCEELGVPRRMRVPGTTRFSSADGAFDESDAYSLIVEQFPGGELEPTQFGLAVLDVQGMGGQWRPPPAYQTDEFERVSLAIWATFGEPRELTWDDNDPTPVGIGHGTVSASAPLAEGAPDREDCRLRICAFPVGYFEIDPPSDPD